MMAERHNLICLAIDRLPATLLGAYGNTTIQTPELDRLAAESFVFDRAVADAIDLPRIYRGWWQGLPALAPQPTATGISLAQLAAQAGWHSALLTDDPAVAALAGAQDFAEQVLIKGPPVKRLAKELEDTQAARLIAGASDWLAEPREPFLLWVHAQGLSGPWDAPYESRSQYADEEDPPPPDWVAPPCKLLAEDYDPDELLGIVQAASGQVSAWDTCLGLLLDELRTSGLAERSLIVLLGPRGYPLGEHRRVGPVDAALYNETVHVPWMIRSPDGQTAWARGQQLVTAADLPRTLASALGWPHTALPSDGRDLVQVLEGHSTQGRQCLVLHGGDDEWSVRTPAWHLLASGPPGERQLELYSKPADRFEVNNVAARAPEVVAGLVEVLDRAIADPTQALGDLDPLLLTEVD